MQVFCPFTHPRPLDEVKRSEHFFFSEEGHVAYQIKVKVVQNIMRVKMFDLPYIPVLLDWVKCQVLKLCR